MPQQTEQTEEKKIVKVYPDYLLYELINPILYDGKKTPAGEKVRLNQVEAERLCLQGAIALKPIKEDAKETATKAKPKEPEPEAKIESKPEKSEPKPAAKKDGP